MKNHKIFQVLKPIAIILTDVLLLAASLVLSQLLAFNAVDSANRGFYAIIFGFNAVFVVAMFLALNEYFIVYKYVNTFSAVKIFGVLALMTLVNSIIAIFSTAISGRWAVIYGLLSCLLIIAERFIIRGFSMIKSRLKDKREAAALKEKPQRIMIVGAGSAGAMLVREIVTTLKVSVVPVCFVDDDETKIGNRLLGVKILGKLENIPELVEKYEIEKIMITMPSAPKKRIKEVLEICSHTKCEVKMLPGLYQYVSGAGAFAQMRKVEIQDLLGREQVRVNLDEIMGYIQDKIVLVTGGGGSIGSELCRQIASHSPKQLIIFDIYENNAYEIEQELRRQHGKFFPLTTLIGSIRDKSKLENLFETYKPEIVFNCAAHKHVPLMETSPNEAVKNNVFGTLNLAQCSDKYGVKRFVQISTDKAVNPTNVMGATKRICEMIIQTIGKRSKTEFVAVRFGNVLGSNGSVIPLFKRQIEEGGPVTVTHKDIIRYFMTIPEAVSLVLQAGAYAKGGEIYVLDMGDPVRIYDLAYNLIRLSGFEPNKDIEIKVTGLRPGEKLFEERLMAEEGLKSTANGLISVAKPISFDEDKFFEDLEALREAAINETMEMRKIIAEIVPTYKPEK